jgi:predicted DNA-binding protein with PD1-like motif
MSSTVVRLLPGELLADQLFDALSTLGARHGIAELSGGTLSTISYCVPADGAESRSVSYSATRTAHQAELVLGAATLGTRDGRPFVHSHCVWLNPEGVLQGGHLWPETRVGHRAPAVVVHALYDVDLVSADDPETLMPVFTPHLTKDHVMLPRRSNDPPRSRSIIARICPNEDITTAVRTLCASAGIRQAAIRGGIGSLIGATFAGGPDRAPRRVEGPGTEVATLVGHLTTDAAGTADLTITCTLVDKFGQVHAGTLVDGENPVAVTYELLLQELIPTPSPEATEQPRKEAHA